MKSPARNPLKYSVQIAKARFISKFCNLIVIKNKAKKNPPKPIINAMNRPKRFSTNSPTKYERIAVINNKIIPII